MVESTIDLDMVEHREFVIKPDFDDGLTRECLDILQLCINCTYIPMINRVVRKPRILTI